MSRSVLFVLSVFIVIGIGSGCDDFMKTVVSKFQTTIDNERTKGFPQVFPVNYVVSHHYNASMLCSHDPCCVFVAAAVLSDSWSRLQGHLNRVHLKHELIIELQRTLDKLADGKFQESPDPSIFPVVQSSPGVLLSYTSGVFSRWMELDCVENQSSDCASPSVDEWEDGDGGDGVRREEEEEEGGEREEGLHGLVEERRPEREGERQRIWDTPAPRNRDSEMRVFPGSSLWMVTWTLMVVMK
ncbi:uncharacterized protein zgc:174888 [Chanos chanos]|uniref:Uncharacterized protein zgc:174888 n=1 Tax=Chanos chanos TaxID=29144 RepID=A0A6J2W9J7_CHACN|nr:uncharacterized protein LOC115820999 [Chanos chanos]